VSDLLLEFPATADFSSIADSVRYVDAIQLQDLMTHCSMCPEMYALMVNMQDVVAWSGATPATVTTALIQGVLIGVFAERARAERVTVLESRK
jgi:hypothetical protein